VGALGVLLAMFTFMTATGGRREERVTRTIVAAPENALFLFTGDNGGPPVLSPDGTRLAFVAVNDASGAQLWVRELASLTTEAIPGTVNASYPFWSADGRSVGFFADGKLKRVDLSTHQVIGICPAPAGRGGSWSASDVIVFSPDFQAGLEQVPAMGGAPTPVTTRAAGQTTHRWPQFLPDGKHVLYYSGNHLNIGGQENSVWVVSLDGRENRMILPSATEAQYADGFLFYVQDSALVARPFDARAAAFTGEAHSTADRVQFDPTTWKANFSVSNANVLIYQPTGGKQGSEIRLYDRAGAMIRRVAEGGNHFNVRISRDGRYVAYSSQVNPNGDIYAYDVERGLGRRLTTDEEDEDLPVFSTDDRSILFTKRMKNGAELGVYSIELMDAGGGLSRTVAKGAKDLWPLDGSADGRLLLVGSGNFSLQVTEALGVLPSDGVGPIRPVDSEKGGINFGRFSNDGRWLAYGATSGGETTVYITGVPGASASNARRIQVSSRGGMLPQWGPGDRELVYVRGDGMIVSVPLAPGTMEPGPEKELFRVVLRPGTSSLDMSANGQRFAVDTLASEGAAPIVVLTNWKRELEKR
jgi:Tol biopolymer transport system component